MPEGFTREYLSGVGGKITYSSAKEPEMTKGLLLAVVLAVAAVASLETCWKDAESVGDGTSKACWYRCVDGPLLRMVGSADRCPLSVRK